MHNYIWKSLFPIILFLASAVTLTVYACGGFAGFALQNETFETQNDTNVLLTFNDGHENLVFEPSYSGNATTFGLVVPFPSRPTLRSAPKEVFGQLENITEQIVPLRIGAPMITMGFGMASKSMPVTVVERKNIGDFTATVLTATSTEALLKWLKDNSFQYHDSDASNFDYYVKKSGYYFVALKVNVDNVDIAADGMLAHKLRPVGFAFDVPDPWLPMRITASDMSEMGFNLYTISSVPYYVPGTDILFSKPLTVETVLQEAPALLLYDGALQWLVRHRIRTNPPGIQEDLILTKGNDELLITNTTTGIKVNTDKLPVKSGIVAGTGTEMELDSSDYTGVRPVPLLMLMRVVLAMLLGSLIGLLYWLFKHRLTPSLTTVKHAVIYVMFGVISFPLAFIIGYIIDQLFIGQEIVTAITLISILIPNVIAAKMYRRKAALYVLLVQILIIFSFLFLLKISTYTQQMEYIFKLILGI